MYDNNNISLVKNSAAPDASGMKMYNSSYDTPMGALIRQVEAEYMEADRVLREKIIRWQRRLKLYQNQRRDEDAVGDTLLFNTMQTVIASLYTDQLLVEWKGEVEGDDEVAEALTHLASYDHRKMHKDVFDYSWAWDTGFFGHSIVYMTDFDMDRKIPIPELQNPMLFLRDPNAVSINGDPLSYKNACRFFGRWIEMTKEQMMMNPEFKDISTVQQDRTVAMDIQLNRQAYQNAQGLTPSMSDSFGDNKTYPLLEWCTQWTPPGESQARKVLVTLANNRKKIVRYHEFEESGKPATCWPVIDRLMYPMSHDWDGTSIPDVIEDKQRMRAVLKNLAIKSLKADLYPMYGYDKNRVKNEANLNFGFNKFIGIDALNGQDVRTALAPIQKAQFNIAVYNYIMESLETDAERSTATPQMQQGSLNQSKRLATELNLVDRNIDTRYSLSAKIWGWSESLFWRRWYQMYKDNFMAHIHEKVIRIDSAYGSQWRTITKDTLTTEEDPDVFIVSKNERDAEELQKSQGFVQYLTFVAQVPGANLRYGIKKLGKLLQYQKDEIERLLPPTVDERIAEDENLQLNKNRPVLVQANDDHVAHLEIHGKAADTVAAYAHRKAHIRALELFKQNPNLQSSDYTQQQQQQQSNQQQTAAGVQGNTPSQQPQPGGGEPASVAAVGKMFQQGKQRQLAGNTRQSAQNNLPAFTGNKAGL